MKIYFPTKIEKNIYIMVYFLPYFALILFLAIISDLMWITFVNIPFLLFLFRISRKQIYCISISKEKVLLEKQGFGFFGILIQRKSKDIKIELDMQYFFDQSFAWPEVRSQLTLKEMDKTVFTIDFGTMKSIEEAYYDIQKRYVSLFLSSVIEKIQMGESVNFGNIWLEKEKIRIEKKEYLIEKMENIEITSKGVPAIKINFYNNESQRIRAIDIGNYGLFVEAFTKLNPNVIMVKN